MSSLISTIFVIFGLYTCFCVNFPIGFIIALISGFALESSLRKRGYLEEKPTPRTTVKLDDSPSESNFDPAAYQDFLDFEAKQDAKINQSQKMSHAEWVKQDADKHKRWAEQEDNLLKIPVVDQDKYLAKL